ncbi:nuclear transport factor 2 family protein [Pseudomonas citronellolis]|uniref:nuclear transport factor 2 family protein n=1 Tax=Pseudomonas citronellolis TaxID=53408 RepID=UPI0020A07023|nr:nuclear transport factor 2 family protein [Pseudomonas citronellolis]MCP1603151.1 ketosteroid isomerase-like protein [Pseudomonas citronellolis]MCP1654209.1 ketosteroid isomerase-like protein [Pseudomonas citronellolis]MCP1720894.1 ketosteroid isomerase-like protein [Pseudomonas citronellolis]
MHTEAIQQEILRLESERCRALVQRDLQTLAALMDDALVHVHATGKVDDKEQYLEMVAKHIDFLSVERSDMRVRVFGDTAIASGRLEQVIVLRESGEERLMKAYTTQVWLRGEGGWRQCAFQATHL